ncbi:F-box protein At5g07610-like [Rhododendron vialii]|uniref:F-box protein At5g07610-like n=1 Tax=Rhododendron vialii TaxID=182163 RepID=UPI00265DBA4A|nr:F-box protein At5g07610-like [Rhododendron vialii]
MGKCLGKGLKRWFCDFCPNFKFGKRFGSRLEILLVTGEVSHTSFMVEYSSSSAAADKVAASSDLLTEILIRLPIRSLMRFKSVSKYWLSLINSDSFSLCRNPNSTAVVSGLFMHPVSDLLTGDTYRSTTVPKLDFIPLTNTTGGSTPTHKPHPHFNDLAFFPCLSGNKRIISSCHGLLLCCFYTELNYRKPDYFILNPTTKQFKILPNRHLSELRGLTLAFDPLRSPHYKIVCAHYDTLICPAVPYYQIATYSSETRSWKASSELFAVDFYKYDNSGVYWNGAVHWFNRRRNRNSLYYNVDEERMGIIPAPPARELRNCCGWDSMHYGEFWGRCSGPESSYYGESGGQLHLVETYRFGPTNQVHVYEMARDYSMWSVKYRVDDLDGIGIVRRPGGCSSISVLCVVRTKRDEESFMVLHVPGKILGYGFADGNFKEICGVAAPEGFDNEGGVQDVLTYFWSDCYPYVESLSRV